MQHNIAGNDIVLLGGTICLLTPSSHLGGKAPRHSERSVGLAELPDRTRSTRTVLSTCVTDGHPKRIPQIKPFIPPWRVPYRLARRPEHLFVTHPGAVRAQQKYSLYSGTPKRLVRCAARRAGYPLFPLPPKGDSLQRRFL